MENTNRPTIIPALAGWDVMQPCHGDEIELRPEPVIGWMVETHFHEKTDEWRAYVTPITNQITGDDKVILRDPAGRLFIPCHQDFNNEAEAIEYLKEREREADRRREQIAARKAVA